MARLSSPRSLRFLGYFAGLLAAAALAGCALTPRFDRDFGQSVRQATAAQTLDPQAGRTPRPVTGIDGASAALIYDNYQKSYRTPESQGSSLTTGSGMR